ncbi:MAG TPA: acyl-CoA dehydrogenase family protein [Gemmatimonadaceae bacterium]|jgi:alkylation response protein AidB-like acyl-CoA dehydrogenase|nr:acyl-CoA dehydrogenase family protein [Gemmatimonadaceae bacterium]
MSDFFQPPPALGNQYDDDRVLRSWLRRVLPRDMLADVEPELRRLGERASGDILALGEAAEAEPPRHVPYDPWGRRVDRIDTSAAWRELDRISAEEGLVAIGYERAHGSLSRVDQFARLYLFSPSSATYSCPLAMSDGAARCLEVYGDNERLRAAYEHLTTRDPSRFWTSGQWMTERTGGSDVSGTSTVARREGDAFRLYGTKWFTSATTSQMAMTLARIEGAPAGSRGLSLFYLELRDHDGSLRDIRVNRLKDKLGTRALPTAELSLEGTPAWLVGEEGRGVRTIATLFNITRIYNACASVAGMRRAIALARDYATRRVAFGKPLSEHPLHVETLAELQVELEAAFHLVFRAVVLLGRVECGNATEREAALLRLLTPVVKLYTAKQAIAVASEALEAFGGAGYIEDTGLPRLLRDAQVLSIWEGTTNVLSLDVLRAIDGGGAMEALCGDIEARLGSVSHARLVAAAEQVRAAARVLVRRATRSGEDGITTMDGPDREAAARALAYSIARTCAGALLLEHASWSLENEHDARSALAALRWCSRELTPPIRVDAAHRAASSALALDRPVEQ